MSATLFPTGRLVATANAVATVSQLDILIAISRHMTGDWGDIDKEDREQNEIALREGLRLFSVYHTENRVRFYVITEWDRSLTTVLLPDDY